MNIIEVLESARDLISDEKAWTQGESARNGNFDPVPAEYEYAEQWCALGAIEKVCISNGIDFDTKLIAMSAINTPCQHEDYYYTELEEKRKKRDTFSIQGDLIMWNDSPETTHEEVINGFEEAIETFKKKQ